MASAALLLLSVVGPSHGALPDTPPKITARAAVILDASTGRVLWERDGDRQLPPASTTKIMTTLLALESGRLERPFTVSPLAAAQAPSKLGLRAGQRVDLEDLTYALMLKSANDASVVVAEGMAGSVEQFASVMNDRAREIGATNTQFHNPHGLPDAEHLTTAHDMALILRHALTVPGFREVAATTGKVIQVEDSKIRPMSLHTKNRLLQGYFVPVIGKTGYTRAAGRCFAGAAELNGRKIITVVFGASDMWGDTRRLMEYGFSGFEETAPAVELARAQQARQPERRVVAKSTKRKGRSTTVASKRRRAPASQVTSAKPAQAVARAKATVQAATKSRATTTVKSSRSSSSSKSASSRGKSSDQIASSSSRAKR